MDLFDDDDDGLMLAAEMSSSRKSSDDTDDDWKSFVAMVICALFVVGIIVIGVLAAVGVV